MNQNQQSNQDATLPQNNPANLTPIINNSPPQTQFQVPPPNQFPSPLTNQINMQQQQPIMFGEEPRIIQQPQVRLNDDDELNLNEQIIEQKENTYDLEKNLSLEIKTSYQQGKLYDSNIQYLPGMISLKTKDEELEPGKQSRVGVDLICLIDKSGSMQGEKIKMVLDSLNILLDFLTEKDRLQLISFNSEAVRLTPLKKMNDLNKEYMKKVISNIRAGGNTTISEATKIAFDQIQTRKQRNHVTSIFLLSDGQDGEAERSVKQQFQQINEVFTIHSFGFGRDHDAKMMTAISDLGKGGFYFVQNISLLDEFFVDALGGLVSVVGADIQIQVKCQPAAPYQDISISKTYSKQWQTVQKNKEYKIEIPQMPSGSRKDFVFELQLPKFTEQINDQNRNPLLMQANVKIKNSKTGEIIQKAAELTLSFFNQDEQLINNEPDIDVLVQYYRVKGTEVIEEANIKCEQNKNEEAQKILEDMIVTIQGNEKVAEKSKGILEDLKQAKQGSNRRQYQDYGQKQMMQMCSNNYQQRGINAQFNMQGMQLQQCAQQPYQNQMQYGFTQARQEQKRGY